MSFEAAYGAQLRAFTEALLRFDTTKGNEAPAQEWLADQLRELGFETYVWMADPDTLLSHPSFPADLPPSEIVDRPSVAGVLEFGEPDAGPTLVLNGHVDVVPANRNRWSSDPFEPTWNGDELTARGAADMKSGVAVGVFAAKYLADTADGLDGRIVVESVAGEEDGGVGAASAVLDSPYPFERDAAIITEPTELKPVVATGGSVMTRLELTGRSAHAARKWRGESVLEHFRKISDAFDELEAERAERVSHPLYERFDNPVPTTIGTLEAGSWASTVPSSLSAELRIGVGPGETVDEVEAEYAETLERVVDGSEWLSAHPPTFERFSIQFEVGEISPDEPIVGALRESMRESGLTDTTPLGETYGADSRHYIEAGIPTVLFGPGSVDQAHFPDETIDWSEVLTASTVVAKTAERLLSS